MPLAGVPVLDVPRAHGGASGTDRRVGETDDAREAGHLLARGRDDERHLLRPASGDARSVYAPVAVQLRAPQAGRADLWYLTARGLYGVPRRNLQQGWALLEVGCDTPSAAGGGTTGSRWPPRRSTATTAVDAVRTTERQSR